MNKYLVRGILYVFIGVVFTPLVLESHPIMMCIQALLLLGLGILYIVKGARSISIKENKL